MAKPVVTVEDVRLHLMDYDTVNLPLFNQILSDAEIQEAIEDAVDEFNEIPPILTRKYTLEDFPFPKILLSGVVARCMGLTALKELRGEMQYNDGGIASTVSYKFPQFNSLRQELEAKYNQDVMRCKRHLNINNCYGGIT